MNTLSLGSTSVATFAAKATNGSTEAAGKQQAKLNTACQEFEALLLEKLLHDATPEDEEGAADGGSGIYREFGQQAVARSIAQSDVLQLSKLMKMYTPSPAAASAQTDKAQ